MMTSPITQSSAFFNATFVEALQDHAPTMEPLHFEIGWATVGGPSMLATINLGLAGF
jgi:hypothetical protein